MKIEANIEHNNAKAVLSSDEKHAPLNVSAKVGWKVVEQLGDPPSQNQRKQNSHSTGEQ